MLEVLYIVIEAGGLQRGIESVLFVNLSEENIILDGSRNDEGLLLHVGDCAPDLLRSALHLRFVHDRVKQGRLPGADLANNDQQLLWLQLKVDILNDWLVALLHEHPLPLLDLRCLFLFCFHLVLLHSVAPRQRHITHRNDWVLTLAAALQLQPGIQVLLHLKNLAESEQYQQEVLDVDESKVENDIHGHEHKIHHSHRGNHDLRF